MANTISDHTSLLSRLRFTSTRQRQAGQWGERRSTKRGEGIEFADFRHYSQGDALRSIDWNLYARFDKPYVRLHEAEQNQTVTLWVDTSPSMDYSKGEVSRLAFTRQLTEDLGAIALLSGDDLCASTHPASHTLQRLRGRGQLGRWHAWMDAVTIQHAANAPDSIAQRPGLAVILSDGYDVPWLERFIPQLAAQHNRVFLLHILTPFERDPSLRGDIRLVDSEDQSEVPMTLGRRELIAYQREFEAWQVGLRSLMLQHTGHYIELDAARPIRQILIEDLRHGLLLQ